MAIAGNGFEPSTYQVTHMRFILSPVKDKQKLGVTVMHNSLLTSSEHLRLSNYNSHIPEYKKHFVNCFFPLLSQRRDQIDCYPSEVESIVLVYQ